MTRSTRILAAAVTTAVALTITGSVTAAEAKPHAAGAHAKPEKAAKPAKPSNGQRQVLRDIARLSRLLDGTVKESRIGMLPTEQQDALHANVDGDKGSLSTLEAEVLAADSTADLRQVRKDLKKVRWVNYHQAVNALRGAVDLKAQLAAYPDLTEATVLVDGAVAKALTVTATSDKSLLKEVRADLAAAKALLEAAAEEAPVEGEPAEGEPVVEEPVEGEPVVEEPVA